MNANEILASKVSTIKSNVCVMFFNEFIKHYNLNEQHAGEAWTMFEKLSTMDITLGLALTTSVSLAKI